jgi:hypothetical protein
MGILLVVELIIYYLDKDNDLVIDDRGIRQVKGVDYKWYQINHCYLASRLEGSYGRCELVILMHGFLGSKKAALDSGFPPANARYLLPQCPKIVFPCDYTHFF